MTCLWHGTLTARRYQLACPRCGQMAGADCDELGRTLVICPCSSAAFLMPLMVGGQGLAWPIDLGNLPIEPEEYEIRKPGVRRCGWEDCPRAVGPRSNYCGRCSPIAAAQRFPCPELGCNNTRSAKASRCQSCARKRHRRQIDAAARAARAVKRQARGQ